MSNIVDNIIKTLDVVVAIEDLYEIVKVMRTTVRRHAMPDVQERIRNIVNFVYLDSSNMDSFETSYDWMDVYPVSIRTFDYDVFQVVDFLPLDEVMVEVVMDITVPIDNHDRI